MPSLRTHTRKLRSATDSPNVRMIKKIPSLSSIKPTKPVDSITVTAITPPTYSPSSSLVRHAIETSDMTTTGVRNLAAIAEALTKTNHMLQSNRAENMKKAYIPKTKLWTTWCQTRRFTDGETVTEGKLCL